MKGLDTKPLRALHVESGRNLYGGAAQVFYLLQGLRDRGVESLLVCDVGSDVGRACAQVGIAAREIRIRGDLDVLFFARLIGIIRDFQPDVVHLHSRRGADVLGGLAGRLCGAKVVLSRRVDNPESRLVVRLKYSIYHRVIAISDGIRRLLVAEGLAESKVALARSAIDTSSFPEAVSRETFLRTFDLDESSLTIAVVAQLIRRKGQALLLGILPELAAAYPQVRILFFGKGADEARLREQARALGVADRCRFAGFRPDVKAFLPHVDVVAHPATMEGLGISLIEAAYCGAPIVASAVGGIPEIARDGCNGYLVPPNDGAALARALLALLGDERLRCQMGAAGREIVEREFLVDTMVESNLSVYRELVGYCD